MKFLTAFLSSLLLIGPQLHAQQLEEQDFYSETEMTQDFELMQRRGPQPRRPVRPDPREDRWGNPRLCSGTFDFRSSGFRGTLNISTNRNGVLTGTVQVQRLGRENVRGRCVMNSRNRAQINFAAVSRNPLRQRHQFRGEVYERGRDIIMSGTYSNGLKSSRVVGTRR